MGLLNWMLQIAVTRPTGCHRYRRLAFAGHRAGGVQYPRAHIRVKSHGRAVLHDDLDVYPRRFADQFRNRHVYAVRGNSQLARDGEPYLAKDA